MATSLEELRFLVAGYYEWCALLGVRLNATKTQLWCNRGAVGRQVRLKFGTETVALATRATFRVVGIELGANERAATDAQFSSRLQKALLTGKRLFGLDVPAAVAAHMWPTTVLAQRLYGCEIRNVPFVCKSPGSSKGTAEACQLLCGRSCLWPTTGSQGLNDLNQLI